MRGQRDALGRVGTFIDDFEAARKAASEKQMAAIVKKPRTIHFLLKPAEEGTGEVSAYPPPVSLRENLDLLPGRLTLHMFEDKIAARWSDLYKGDPLSIRTVTRVRSIVREYAKQNGYSFILIDTSPSLGALNKVIISTVDGFLIPCLPDMFSLYGIRNIGNALGRWKSEFETIYKLISEGKREQFPPAFVRFLGFTIYNAKKRSGSGEMDMAKAHENYARQIPTTIRDHVPADVRRSVEQVLSKPIGGNEVMHTHNTLPSMAQKYRLPIWLIPECESLDSEDKSTIMGNRTTYESKRSVYHAFASDLIRRLEMSTATTRG